MSSIPSRRELLAWFLALILMLGLVAVVSGSERAGAGVSGPVTEVVYIATGANFPDALAAAATAAVGLGPVLLVAQNAVPTATLNELNRLQPSRIVIVGGTAVISAGVQSQLEGLGFSPTVSRIAGANRFETAAKLSQASFPSSGLYPRAAHAGAETTIVGSGNLVTLLSVDIEAPAPGVLVINGGGRFSTATTGTANCLIRVNGALVFGTVRTSRLGTDNKQVVCTTETGIDVAAGTHTVEYVGQFESSVSTNRRNLTVLWVPFDGTGAAPSP